MPAFPPRAQVLTAALASASALLVAACGGASDRPRAGVITLNEMFEAEFTLVDQDGATATDERFEGKVMFIYYGFTTCPEICPSALGAMTATLDLLGKAADEVAPLMITVDPKRDTPERLKNHLAYDPRLIGLTGSVEAVEDAKTALKVYAVDVALPDSALGYTVDHTRLFYITDRAGTPIWAVPDTVAPGVLADLIKELM